MNLNGCTKDLALAVGAHTSLVGTTPPGDGPLYLPASSHNMQVPQEGNPEQATGSYIAGIAGVRISTPIFGTGFNFCIGECATSLAASHGPSCIIHPAVASKQLEGVVT